MIPAPLARRRTTLENNLTYPQKKRRDPSKFSPILVMLLLGFALITLIGCSPKTTEANLPLLPPQNFSDSGTQALPEKWWTTFGDQRLNALVDTALAANFNLRIAWQRLREAQAIVDRESALLLPTVGTNLQGGLNFPLPDFRGGENIRLGLASEYEVDLWGRIRSGIDAERYRAEATLADYQTAALSLSAEIVRTWYQLLAAENQLELSEEQITTNEQILRLIRNRFGGGEIRGVDILRQQQLLEATREQRINAEARVQVLEHQLAVLLGQAPQREIAYTARPLPDLPPLPETGVPLDLVRRRPDVQSAFLLLQAADRDLASAISSQYPRLSLSAAASLRSNNFQNIFKEWAYSFAGNIFAPIFNGGELRAEVDRNEALKQQRLYQYGQSVLVAFQEVEDALIQEQKQAERIGVLEEQLALARKTNEQLRVEYFNGFSNYLDVLTTLDQEQALRRELISARLMLLEFRIALYRALAGGFATGREVDG